MSINMTYRIEELVDDGDGNVKNIVVPVNQKENGRPSESGLSRLCWCPRLLRWMLLTLSAAYLLFGSCAICLVDVLPASLGLKILAIHPIWVAVVMQMVIVVTLASLFVFNCLVRLKSARECRLARKAEFDFVEHLLDRVKEMTVAHAPHRESGTRRYEIRIIRSSLCALLSALLVGTVGCSDSTERDLESYSRDCDGCLWGITCREHRSGRYYVGDDEFLDCTLRVYCKDCENKLRKKRDEYRLWCKRHRDKVVNPREWNLYYRGRSEPCVEDENPGEVENREDILPKKDLVSDEPKAVEKKPDVVPPKLLSAIELEYPRRARRRGEEGSVTLEVKISESGLVSEVKVATSSGYSYLDEEAVRATREARFRPSTQDGVAVPSTAKLTLQFKLNQSEE